MRRKRGGERGEGIGLGHHAASLPSSRQRSEFGVARFSSDTLQTTLQLDLMMSATAIGAMPAGSVRSIHIPVMVKTRFETVVPFCICFNLVPFDLLLISVAAGSTGGYDLG